MAAPKGNTNGRKENRLWGDAIRRRIKQGKSLNILADKLVAMAEGGDMHAIKEIGDRLDGRAVQAINQTTKAKVKIDLVDYSHLGKTDQTP